MKDSESIKLELNRENLIVLFEQGTGIREFNFSGCRNLTGFGSSQHFYFGELRTLNFEQVLLPTEWFNGWLCL